MTNSPLFSLALTSSVCAPLDGLKSCETNPPVVALSSGTSPPAAKPRGLYWVEVFEPTPIDSPVDDPDDWPLLVDVLAPTVPRGGYFNCEAVLSSAFAAPAAP